MQHRSPRSFPAIPGTTPAPRALFVDRWGTLLDPPARGFAREPAEVRFHEGVLEALFRAGRSGWRIYLLGNEPAVADGRLDDGAWQAVDGHVLGTLAGAGVPIARSYTCVDHPEGVPGHRADSVYLLPNTGAFYHAAHNDGVELAKSWVVGDSTVELVAGWRSGCRLAGVRTGLGLADGTFHVEPELVGADLREVLTQLLELAWSLQR